MLAQNFKTVIELGVDSVLVDVLHTILPMLEREEIRHAPMAGGVANVAPTAFNMARILCKTDCGTAGCLLGWARHFRAHTFRVDWKNEALSNLFQPDIDESRWDSITTAQAATALRNYLTHGDPRWAEAMAA